MNIALATDDRYAMACGVCITSVIENNHCEDLHFYILTQGISDDSSSKFETLKKKYGVEIDILNVDTSVLEGLKVSSRFPISIYYRLLLPQILKCDKVLYLDCDIIVKGELKPLWNLDMEGTPAIVVEDQCSDDIRVLNRVGREGPYFNSGVMLMNLVYWRDQALSKKCVDFLYENPQICRYPDQDAMNCIIGDQVRYAEYGYNFQELMYMKPEKLLLHRSKWENIFKWKSAPVVLHYTGWIKPWYVECNHPERDTFLRFKKLSPWADSQLLRFYGIGDRICMWGRKWLRKL